MNEEAIKKAVAQHEKSFSGKYINPISQVDVRIISTLLKILDKCGHGEVSQALEKYKAVSDEDIALRLEKINVNIDTENPIKDFFNGLAGRRTKVITFSDMDCNCIELNVIFTWRKADDKYGNPGILLNEGDLDASKHPIIYNRMLSYDSEETRDDDFDLITKRKNGR